MNLLFFTLFEASVFAALAMGAPRHWSMLLLIWAALAYTYYVRLGYTCRAVMEYRLSLTLVGGSLLLSWALLALTLLGFVLSPGWLRFGLFLLMVGHVGCNTRILRQALVGYAARAVRPKVTPV